MIDLHCHYLPAVDDGAATVADGLNLARAAVDNGIQHAVLTPHVFFGRWSNYLAKLQKQFDEFRRQLADARIPLSISLGAEVHLMPDSLALFENGQMPFIGALQDRPMVLLEFHDGHIPPGAIKGCEYFIAQGVLPLIAHPERNKGVMGSIDKLSPFIEMGCLTQITAASLCGGFGPRAEKTALEIVGRGWAFAVASDAHNLAHRPPRMAEARDVLYQQFGMQASVDLTYTNPSRVIEADPKRHAVATPPADTIAAPTRMQVADERLRHPTTSA